MQPPRTVTGPEEEPIILATAKAQCGLHETDTDQDALLESLIPKARELAEGDMCGIALVTRTLEVRLDCFPSRIVLPHPPLQSVDSITYVDAAGAEQTLATSLYTVYGIYTPPEDEEPPTTEEPPVGFILPAFGLSWPTTQLVPEAVRVEFTCGFGTKDQVPAKRAHAVALWVARLFEERNPGIVGTIFADTKLGERMAWPPNFTS